jgi:CheY-like chemotaxis protein
LAFSIYQRRNWSADREAPIMIPTPPPPPAALLNGNESAAGALYVEARGRIVAFTANAMQHQVAEYAAAGMDGVVAKPIMIEKLYAALMGVNPLRTA